MPRVRIDKKAYKSFTGQMGDIEFINGESVESLSKAEARRLGSFITVVDVEDDKQLGHGQELADARGKSVKDVKASKEELKAKQEASKQAEKEAREARKAGKKAEKPVKKKAPDLNYSEESLAKLADEKGINGLRDFAKEYDVYGRSIVEIIQKMMQLKQHGARST